MLIVSKFHDYYDVMARQGVDKTLVYKRETVETGDFLDFARRGSGYEERWGDPRYPEFRRLDADRIAVLFCGKLFFLWRGMLLKNAYRDNEVDGRVFTAATKAGLLDMVQQAYGLGEPNAKQSLVKGKWYRQRRDTEVRFEEDVGRLDREALHVKYKSPVILLQMSGRGGYFQNNRYKVIVNPVLKDLGFEKMVDPYTAWQEITMYLGGVIGQPDRPMVQLNDVELRDKAGFDKWSFKKMPSA